MSRVKSCFKSRFGADGRIVQVDFSQLEVIGVAYLSQDPLMYEDINNGIDSHSQSASWLTEHSYEEVLEGHLAGDKHLTQVRKNAKGPRFELQYGAGAKSIGENNGISKEVAQGFIDQYYGRYSVLQQWQEDNISYVNNHTEGRKKWVVTKKAYIEGGHYEECSHSTSVGDTIVEGHWQAYPEHQRYWRTEVHHKEQGYWHHWIVGKLPSITGRVYTFKQFDTPDFIREKSGVLKNFSPTQVKNYPSQGFATGDVVPLMLGVSYRRIVGSDRFRDKALHIGTIHDSLLYDVHKDVHDEFCPGINKLMEQAPKYIEKVFGFKFDLPLKCETESGETWDTLKRVEL